MLVREKQSEILAKIFGKKKQKTHVTGQNQESFL